MLRRTSRFSVLVHGHGQTHAAHLTNSGRLHDLIYPGSACLCTPKPPAKTTLRLVGVPISDLWAVLVDPNIQSMCFAKAAHARHIPWLEGWSITNTEVNCGESRIDYLISDGTATGYIEVKSAAMLIQNHTGSFPDCPTIRGRKHLFTMRRLSENHRSIVLFLVQHPEAALFAPNREGDSVFADTLHQVARDGVEVRAIKMCMRTDGRVELVNPDLYCMV